LAFSVGKPLQKSERAPLRKEVVPLYVNEKFADANVQLVRNIGGPVWQVHWVANYESLATFEEVMKRVEADSGYLELLGEARDQKLFISSGTVDSLYEAIS
jgi:hypothetical protein